MTRWRVERSGSASGYAAGWLAYNPVTESGAWFRMHAEAVAFATLRSRAELEVDAKRGLLKLASRGVAAAGVAASPSTRRPYHRLTDTEIRSAVAMRENGRTYAEIADVLGVQVGTISKAIRREQGVRP